MEQNQIRDVAMAYYKRSSAEVKERVQRLFGALDVNGDGRVSRAEYRSVTGSDEFFDVIDQNGDGTLDFEEVLTIVYMSRIGLRACDGCRDSLTGSYFSCMLCEIEFPSTYDLCCACYGGGKFHHHHSADKFLDDRSMRLLLSLYLQQPAESKGKVKTAFDVIRTGLSIGCTVVKIGTVAVHGGCIIM